MHILLDSLSYPFVVRAFAVGALVSLSASLLGVILVLKRYSLIGHGLADIGFASLTIGLALGLPPLLFAGPTVVAAAIAMMLVSQRCGVSGDIAIGVAATGSLALGIIVAAAGPGINLDIHNYMFGSILSVTRGDVWIAACLAAVVVSLFCLFHNRLFLVTFDEMFARAAGMRISFYHFLIALLTALTVVAGMRMAGTLLISGLVIFPAVTARRLAASFKGMMILSATLGLAGFVAGMVLSLLTDWPAGACVVVADALFFAMSFIVTRIKAQ